jgi:sporulation protein YlmC with PRC-barrel domain
VPVTGDVNPARISHQLDFTVWSQDGEQIGDVEDMVLHLDDARVAYVIVGTGGFLDLGEREILVPWNFLTLQTGTGETTGGQENVFILQGDLEVFRNAPDFDLGALPQMGKPAADWDVDLRTYWESGGAIGDTATTPAANETATAGTGGTGRATEQATQPAATNQGTATVAPGVGDVQRQALEGVVLASEVLGSTINWGAQGQGTGTGQGTETPQAGAGTGQETATPSGAAGTGTETPVAGGVAPGTGQGNTTGTIEDMIVEIDTGNILYIVITAAFEEGERWIPAPLTLFRWNGAAGAFTLDADATLLQNAPSFENGQFPNTTTAGWNADIDAFWQNNGGTGMGAQATATP